MKLFIKPRVEQTAPPAQTEPVKDSTVKTKKKAAKPAKRADARGAPSKASIATARNKVKSYEKLLANRIAIRDKAISTAKGYLSAAVERLKGLEKRATSA